ncbi:MAG: AMP-binding protein [Synergistetes bacterium]|nr:AMP-binding protein [Synergistota bacterium]
MKLEKSYLHGLGSFPLIGKTIGEDFELIVSKHPNNEALVSFHQGKRYTYKDLNDVVDSFAKGLLSLGVKKGDRVALWSTNNAEWVIVMLGCMKIGAILVNVNSAFKTRDFEYVIKKSETSTLIIEDEYKNLKYAEMVYELVPELKSSKLGELKSKAFPNLKNVIHLSDKHLEGMFTFNEILQMDYPDEDYKFIKSKVKFDDVANIQFTSGTTGFPKGVMLTHHNLINNAYDIGEHMRFTSKDRLCIPVPLFHCFGMVLGVLACTTHGATSVLPSAAFDTESTLKAIEKERCTAVHGVPTMFINMLNHQDFKSFNLKSLRTGIMAGATCPVEVMRRVNTEMNMSEVVITYGLTEASPGVTMTETNDTLEHRVKTVGKPMAHVEVKIADLYTGEICPVNTPGEVCTRGYNVMKGYYKEPRATRRVIDEEGWLHTGDIGIMDEDGYVKITGRSKDIIIRGGENISPREIEELLLEHPKVKEAQVVGIPDKKYGEQVAAFIILKPGENLTEEEVKAFCKEKVADFKVPQVVKFVDKFPMTASGKIQKFKLKEEFISPEKKEKEIKPKVLLKGITTVVGNNIKATSTVSLLVDGKEYTGAGIGKGPVDASLNTIRSLLKEHINFKLKEFSVEAVTGGSDALGDVYVEIEENGITANSHAAKDDIILASVEAVINAINILDAKKHSGKN